MTPDTTEINFTDKAKISNFAKASVSLCQRCGIINGYEDGFESVIQKVSANKWPSSSTDAARLVFTRDWGHTLCFDAKDAVTVDSEGFITSVAADKDVAIPSLDEGYVLAQRSRRQYEGDFFDSCQVGDRISLDLNYDGSSTQDIMLSVAAGPRLVKNGQVYGGLNTYISEGFSDPNITTYTALRMCIGIKPDGNLLIATATCTLQELSSILVKLGCSDGINLDGGGSATLYVGGQWLCGPQSRKLNNMIVFQ